MQKIKFEFNPDNITPLLDFLSKSWNEFPNTKVVETSSGLVSHDEATQYVELVLAEVTK